VNSWRVIPSGTVVLGSRGRGPVTSLLGSVGVGVSKHAVCPVAVVTLNRPERMNGAAVEIGQRIAGFSRFRDRR
jgi:hypothetical protein